MRCSRRYREQQAGEKRGIIWHRTSSLLRFDLGTDALTTTAFNFAVQPENELSPLADVFG